jgi:hypothetical protein
MGKNLDKDLVERREKVRPLTVRQGVSSSSSFGRYAQRTEKGWWGHVHRFGG